MNKNWLGEFAADFKSRMTLPIVKKAMISAYHDIIREMHLNISDIVIVRGIPHLIIRSTRYMDRQYLLTVSLFDFSDIKLLACFNDLEVVENLETVREVIGRMR